jgi:hypothetical protein
MRRKKYSCSCRQCDLLRPPDGGNNLETTEEISRTQSKSRTTAPPKRSMSPRVPDAAPSSKAHQVPAPGGETTNKAKLIQAKEDRGITAAKAPSAREGTQHRKNFTLRMCRSENKIVRFLKQFFVCFGKVVVNWHRNKSPFSIECSHLFLRYKR